MSARGSVDLGGESAWPLAVTAWLGAPPDVWHESAVLTKLVDDLLELLADYPIGDIYSGEPRFYRRTPRGRVLLAEAPA